jgi:hypothetical protein
MKRPWIIAALVSCILIGIFCACLFAILLAGYIYNQPTITSEINAFNFNATPTTTPIVIRPTATTEPTEQAVQTPNETPLPTLPTPTAPVAQASTLQNLQQVVVPINDPYAIAARLEGKKDVPTTLEPPPAPLQVGARDTFWFLNTETNENLQAQATLRYVTDHTYFWIEDGLSYRERDLRDLAETFEQQIYPTNRDFFGSEWTPGVDGDPHIYVLYVKGVGGNTSGFFFRKPTRGWNSNGRGYQPIWTLRTLRRAGADAIHWYHDRTNLLAMGQLSTGTIGDFTYCRTPIFDWPVTQMNHPHYGAAFVVMTGSEHPAQ